MSRFNRPENGTRNQINSSKASSLNPAQPFHPSPSNFSDGLSAFPETFSELNFRFVRRRRGRRRNNLFLAKNVCSVVYYGRSLGNIKAFIASSVTRHSQNVLMCSAVIKYLWEVGWILQSDSLWLATFHSNYYEEILGLNRKVNVMEVLLKSQKSPTYVGIFLTTCQSGHATRAHGDDDRCSYLRRHKT